MARNWQYPRWRRLLMQSAMWGILGLTVGLAAFVDRHALVKRLIALGPPVDCGSIRLQLPRDAVEANGFDKPGMINADLGVPTPYEHRLFVTVTPPAQAGMLEQIFEHQPSSEHLDDVPFGDNGSTGPMYIHAEIINGRRGVQSVIEVVATSHLKDGPQVTIRSERIGLPGDVKMEAGTDIDLVKQIASTVTETAVSAFASASRGKSL